MCEQDRPLDDGQRSQLEKQAAQYEERLKKDDKDAAALEGGGSTYAVLGSYDKAVALLTRLTQTRPEESSSWRLLVSLKPYGPLHSGSVRRNHDTSDAVLSELAH